jgi:hypothetical protein
MRDSVWSFVLKWAAANGVGGLIAAVLGIPFLSSDEPTHKVIAGTALGVGFGIGQWLLVRHYLDRATWWIVATVVGFAVAGALMGTGTTEELARRGLSTETIGLAIGATAGVSQWVVLRSRSPRAAWWIPASIASFGLGWFVNWTVDFGLDYNDPRSLILGLGVILVPFVLISGVSLWWILPPRSGIKP